MGLWHRPGDRCTVRGVAEEQVLSSEASAGVHINFQRARHQIEALGDRYPSSVRWRALALYVALFDFADEAGVVAIPSDQLTAMLEITRNSWVLYRDTLVAAGLLVVAEQRGGLQRPVQLLAPGG